MDETPLYTATVEATGFDPERDIGPPFDVEAVVAASYGMASKPQKRGSRGRRR